MKQGSFRAVRQAIFLLITLSLTVFSVFGDENTVSQMSIVLDKFNGATSKGWDIGGRAFSYEYDWAVDASKFAATVNNEHFPRMTYVDAWPMALFGSNRNNLDIRSLGVWGRFDRRGYNWVDLYPIVPGSGETGKIRYLLKFPYLGGFNILICGSGGQTLI